MRLLVVGGTSFVGRTFIEAALAAEHHVTTFNRGRTGADVPGADVVRGDRESVTILLASLRGGRGTRCSTRRAMCPPSSLRLCARSVTGSAGTCSYRRSVPTGTGQRNR